MKHKALPKLEELKKVLDYNPDTGVFTWKVSRGPIKAGSVAGQRWVDYIRISYKTKSYQAHRLAWLFITGEDPGETIVDHIDCDKQNNKASNLQIATRSENGAKTLRGEPKCYQRCGKDGKYFQAIYTLKGKRYHVGVFATAEEASKVGREARKLARGII